MSSKDLDKARNLLREEQWLVKSAKSLAIGGAWLVSLEGTDDDGDDQIEVCRLTLAEMDQVRAEFPDKFKRAR